MVIKSVEAPKDEGDFEARATSSAFEQLERDFQELLEASIQVKPRESTHFFTSFPWFQPFRGRFAGDSARACGRQVAGALPERVREAAPSAQEEPRERASRHVWGGFSVAVPRPFFYPQRPRKRWRTLGKRAFSRWF